jgi:hypothetical protein
LKADCDAECLNRHLAKLARDELIPSLCTYWNGVPARSETSKEKPADRESTDPWNEKAELFVAMLVVNLIRQVFAHIQNMMTFTVLILMCLLISFQGYPFQPGGLIMLLWLGLMSWTLGVVVIAMIKFNRNEVLSRISGTTPNKFTFDRSLVNPFIVYVATPIIGMLSVYVPPLGRTMSNWTDVMSRLFRT